MAVKTGGDIIRKSFFSTSAVVFLLLLFIVVIIVITTFFFWLEHHTRPRKRKHDNHRGNAIISVRRRYLQCGHVGFSALPPPPPPPSRPGRGFWRRANYNNVQEEQTITRKVTHATKKETQRLYFRKRLTVLYTPTGIITCPAYLTYNSVTIPSLDRGRQFTARV